MIWLAATRDIPLLQAYHVDASKVGLFGKEQHAAGFAALEVNVEKYFVMPVEDREIDYLVLERIAPLDLKVVGLIDLRTARRSFARKFGMPRNFYTRKA